MYWWKYRWSFTNFMVYSLTVLNIDPPIHWEQCRRREILKQLDEEGVLPWIKVGTPLLTQRIAVISSATAAGYGDFCNQLEHNRMALYSIASFLPSCRWQGGGDNHCGSRYHQCAARWLGCGGHLSGEAGCHFDLHDAIRPGGGSARSFRCLSLPASVMNATILFLTVYRIHVKLRQLLPGFHQPSAPLRRLAAGRFMLRPFFMRSTTRMGGKDKTHPPGERIPMQTRMRLREERYPAGTCVIRQMEVNLVIPVWWGESHRLELVEAIGQSVAEETDGRESSSPVPGATDKGTSPNICWNAVTALPLKKAKQSRMLPAWRRATNSSPFGKRRSRKYSNHR